MSAEREGISTACFAHKIDDEDIANRHTQLIIAIAKRGKTKYKARVI